MIFSEEVVRQAWERAEKRCECKRLLHNHAGSCNQMLIWEHRGRDRGAASWEARHVIRTENGGEDILSNCVILCWECHQRTF